MLLLGLPEFCSKAPLRTGRLGKADAGFRGMALAHGTFPSLCSY